MPKEWEDGGVCRGSICHTLREFSFYTLCFYTVFIHEKKRSRNKTRTHLLAQGDTGVQEGREMGFG